jgi:hypothetical protein
MQRKMQSVPQTALETVIKSASRKFLYASNQYG